MRQTTALLWKEAREHRWLLVASLALFLGFPLLMAAIASHHPRYPRFYSDEGEGVVLGLGGLLAVILAVGTTCRDLGGSLEGFWRSRPIGLGKLLLTKFAVGLCVLLLVTCGTLVMQLVMYAKALGPWHKSSSVGILLVHTFTLILVFSVSFLLGCLVRHAARAAVLSVMAGLLIYFLPMILPPLGWVSVFNIILGVRSRTHWRLWVAANAEDLVPFVTVMLAGSTVTVALAFLAVQRNWRLRVNKRFLAWMLVGVLLLLWTTAGTQIGSNLRAEQIIPLPPAGGDMENRALSELECDGRRGVVLTFKGHEWSNWNEAMYGLRVFDLDEERITAPVPLGGTNPALWGLRPGSSVAWSPSEPDRVYVLWGGVKWNGGRSTLTEVVLHTVVFDTEGGKIRHTLDLMPHVRDKSRFTSRVRMHNNRIYVCLRGEELLLIDITGRDAPALMESRRLDRWGLRLRRRKPGQWRSEALIGIDLLPLDGLTQQERIKTTVALTSREFRLAAENDLLVVMAPRKHLTTYRIIPETADYVRLEMLGRRFVTPLERIVGNWPRKLAVRDGLAFLIGGTGYRGVTVFDLRDPTRPRRVGHYAAPGEYFNDIVPLPGGRVLVADKNLHVLAAPRLE